jgi:hypothetical protein
MTLFSYFNTAAIKEKARKLGTEEQDMLTSILCPAMNLPHRITYFPFINSGLGAGQMRNFKAFYIVHSLKNYSKEQRYLKSSHKKIEL